MVKVTSTRPPKTTSGSASAVSPRGTHSAHMGSGNYTISVRPRLYGVARRARRRIEHNAPARAFLEKNGEGIERIAFTAIDSTAGAEEIRRAEDCRRSARSISSGR